MYLPSGEKVGAVEDRGWTDLANLAVDVDQCEAAMSRNTRKASHRSDSSEILKRLDGTAAPGGLLDVRLDRRQVLICRSRPASSPGPSSPRAFANLPSRNRRMPYSRERSSPCSLLPVAVSTIHSSMPAGVIFPTAMYLPSGDHCGDIICAPAGNANRSLFAVDDVLELHSDEVCLAMLTVRVRIDTRSRESQHRLRQFGDRRITKRFEQRQTVAYRRDGNRRDRRSVQHVHDLLRRLFVRALGETRYRKN